VISADLVGRRLQAQARPTTQRTRIAGWPLIFAPAALVYLVAGWYLAIVRQVYDGDAVSRTAQAAAVVLGRDPHLAAIGFVWNPLPGLVQIPLVLLLRPFGLQIYAGAIQSALCMAGTVALLWCFTGLYDSNTARRGAFVLLFAANPLILLYAANGMSEGMFYFFLTGMAYTFARWARERRHMSLVGMAVMAAGAFGVRYESLPLAGAGFLAVLIVLLADRKRDRHLVEASLLVYLAPVVYAVALWVFFNWAIMGDPFFFQRSIYSNDAQTAVFNTTDNYLAGVVGSPLGTLRYVGERLLACFFAFGIVLLAAAVAAWRRRWSILGLAGLTLAIPVFHLYALYTGASWGWLRFFMCSIPAAFLLAPPLLAEVRGRWTHRIAVGALLIAFAASNVVGLWAMQDPDLGRQEHLYLGRVADADFPLPNSRSNAEDRAVAAYVQEHLGGQRILLDTVQGYAVWLHADHPEQFVIFSDRDFVEILEQPVGQVEYLLVPSPTVGRADRINVRYPELYANGLPWVTLVRDFSGEVGWRIFRIVPSTTP
jgi:hypothetical protein